MKNLINIMKVSNRELGHALGSDTHHLSTEYQAKIQLIYFKVNR